MDWNFGRSEGRQGFTATAMTYFAGTPLASTVRECIQNSLDASLGDQIDVAFTLDHHEVDGMPGLQKLVPFLESALKAELESNEELSEDELKNLNSISFYRGALTLVRNKEITVLGIHDWGTSGLKGHVKETQGLKPSPWLALILGEGVDVKDSKDSLGSFGQGSMAPYALSRLRTLFYLSRSNEPSGVADRFVGKAILSSSWQTDEDGQNYLTRAKGYFSTGESVEPLTGNDIPAWAFDSRTSLTEETGTSIYIPAPVETVEGNRFEYSLMAEILLNFYYAIESGRLRVHLPGGKILDKDSVKKEAIDSAILEDDTLDEGQLATLRTLVTSKVKGLKTSKVFGEYFFAIRTGEELASKKVGIARKTGMLITRRAKHLDRFPGVKNFDLFVCVKDLEGSRVLRDLENPSHDAFEFERVSDPIKQKSHKKLYLSFTDELRELISEYASLELETELWVDDLNDLLGSEGEQELPEGDSSEDLEFATTTKLRRTRVRSKHETSFRGASLPGGFGKGGSGKGSGGNSGGTGGDGDGDKEGKSGQKLRVVSDPILERTSTGGHRLVFTVLNPSEAKSLLIFSSGETSLEPIRLAAEAGGPLQSELERSRWKTLKGSKTRFEVEFHTSSKIFGLEAFTNDAD